jgi:hypothetical protein
MSQLLYSTLQAGLTIALNQCRIYRSNLCRLRRIQLDEKKSPGLCNGAAAAVKRSEQNFKALEMI